MGFWEQHLYLDRLIRRKRLEAGLDPETGAKPDPYKSAPVISDPNQVAALFG